MSDMTWAEYIELCEAATEGPWQSTHKVTFGGGECGHADVSGPARSKYAGMIRVGDVTVTNDDGDFIAASRTMGPKAARIALAVEKWLEAVALGQCRVPLETTPKMMLTAILAGKGHDDE